MTQTLEASCPGKVIAFGEWAVVCGHPGVGLPVDGRFRMRISAKKGPHLFFRIKSCWIKQNWQFSTPPKKFPVEWQFFGRVFFATLYRTLLKDRRFNDFTITLSCDWDPKEGLGSSSALVLCVLALTESWNAKSPGSLKSSPQSLFLKGRRWIRKLQSPKASGLDLATQIFGKATLLRAGKIQTLPVLKIPKGTVLIHTYKKFNTREKLRKSNLPSDFYHEISGSIRELLTLPSSPRQFSESIKTHHDTLSRFPFIVPVKIKNEMKSLVRKGVVDCIKTTGAGGGDALLGIVNPGKFKELKSWAKDRGYKLRPKSCFDTLGLRIHK